MLSEEERIKSVTIIPSSRNSNTNSIEIDENKVKIMNSLGPDKSKFFFRKRTKSSSKNASENLAPPSPSIKAIDDERPYSKTPIIIPRTKVLENTIGMNGSQRTVGRKTSIFSK